MNKTIEKYVPIVQWNGINSIKQLFFFSSSLSKRCKSIGHSFLDEKFLIQKTFLSQSLTHSFSFHSPNRFRLEENEKYFFFIFFPKFNFTLLNHHHHHHHQWWFHYFRLSTRKYREKLPGTSIVRTTRILCVCVCLISFFFTNKPNQPAAEP